MLVKGAQVCSLADLFWRVIVMYYKIYQYDTTNGRVTQCYDIDHITGDTVNVFDHEYRTRLLLYTPYPCGWFSTKEAYFDRSLVSVPITQQVNQWCRVVQKKVIESHKGGTMFSVWVKINIMLGHVSMIHEHYYRNRIHLYMCIMEYFCIGITNSCVESHILRWR